MEDYWNDETEELKESDPRIWDLGICLEFADAPEMIGVSFGDKHGGYLLRTVYISDLKVYLDGFEDRKKMVDQRRNNKGLEEEIY